MSDLTEKYSGVILNQNQKPGSSDFVSGTTGKTYYQEFYLPVNFERGTTAGEIIKPALSGFQLFVEVTDSEAASIDWTLDYQIFGAGITPLTSGTTTATDTDGNVWMDLVFANGVDIPTENNLKLRFGFKVTAGIDKVWCSTPNPLSTQFVKLYEEDGTTPAVELATEGSACFRVLGLVADEGVDFLGNQYRSALVSSNAIDTSRVDGDKDKFWMSKPNPSKFAVESLYYDVRPRQDTPTYTSGTPDPLTVNDDVIVIDHVIVDPLTPGVYFNIYYATDGAPGTNDEEWEDRLWTHVPKTYCALKRDSYALPAPILAKYVKIEFSHLQAKSYSPGDLARPMQYKKHPKWVLDYFLARAQADADTSNKLVSGRVGVIYDALSLAYDYYLDDLKSTANPPAEIDDQAVKNFLGQLDDKSDLVDSETLSKINLSLAPYRNHPGTFAKTDYLPGTYARAGAAREGGNYPTEGAPDSIIYPDIQELRSESVIIEADFPVMFFYLTCRHTYREVIASFEQDRAYFVGVKEVAFTRENYASEYDTDQYTEPAGDLRNVELNDFTTVDGTMVL